MSRLATTLLLPIALGASGLALAQAPTVPLAIDFWKPGFKWGPCPPIFSADCSLAVLQGDPAKPHADALLRVRPGAALPRHKHTSAEHMTLLQGQLSVTYDGSPTVVLRRSSYAYGPAGLPHDARCTSRVACVLFIAFEGPVDAIAVP
jgi:quercetin dioxygenase-like cupin family protein